MKLVKRRRKNSKNKTKQKQEKKLIKRLKGYGTNRNEGKRSEEASVKEMKRGETRIKKRGKY